MSVATDEPCLYVDTSALGRVLTRHATGRSVLDALDMFEVISSSELLRVELLRMAGVQGIDAQDAEKLITRIGLVPLLADLVRDAETVPPPYVRTLDALHLATILRLRENDAVHAVLTYDEDLIRACGEHGIQTLSPAA